MQPSARNGRQLMTLENKLGITSSFELAHEEELLSKRRALDSLFVRIATEIKAVLKEPLIDKVDDRQVYMKSIDASSSYESYCTYSMGSL